MDVSRYIHTFFFSWRGRSRSLVWNVRVKFATKTLLPWENGHLLPFMSRAQMRSECVQVSGENRRYDSIFGPFEKCSYFSSPGFLLYR